MRSGSAGFTYIGLLVIIALLGLALSVAGEVTRTSVQRERETQLLFVGHEYRHAIARFVRQNHRYPVSLEELVQTDTGGPVPAHYLRRAYPDPMTGATDWTLLPAPGDGFMGIASRSEKVPLKKTGFDLSDEQFENAETYADWIFSFDPRARISVRPTP
jgi:type II secretory pathway pseudopilin PulG